MDKKYIEALSNFAFALDELVEIMKQKEKSDAKGGGTDGLFKQTNEINSTLIEINKDVQQIKSDQQKVLDNQSELLTVAKDIRDAKSKGNVFDKVSEDSNRKKSITDGAATVVLIAAAVLAIGIAFKLIGSVDFASVIALSIALPLIAFAFMHISTKMSEYGIGLGEMAITTAAVAIMAVGVVAASWILSGAATLGFFQMISILFVGLTLGLLVGGFKIGGFQFGGIGGMVESLKEIKYNDLLKLPFALVLISVAIAVSSHILAMSAQIPLGKFFSILLTTTVLGVAAMLMALPILILGKMGLQAIAMGSLGLILVAGAIMVSSWLLSMGTYDNYPGIGWALGVGTAMLLFTAPVIALGLVAISGIGFAAIALGAISVLIVAGTIMATSHILNSGDYDNYPGIGWTLGVGTAMLLFTAPMIALGLLAITGIGFLVIALGAVSILMVAGTIMATSHILNSGNYDSYPGIDWALGTSLSLLLFGSMMANPAWLLVLLFGSLAAPALLLVAKTIVDVSNKLAEGQYDYGGDLAKWALATVLLYYAFFPLIILAGVIRAIESFWGGDLFGDGSSVMLRVAQTIVDISNKLSEGSYSNGKELVDWASGVATMYPSIVSTLLWMSWWKDEILEGLPVLYSLSTAIMISSHLLANGNYSNYPTKEWSDGVSGSIEAFSYVFEYLMMANIMDAILGSGGMTGEQFAQVMVDVAKGIVAVDEEFAKGGGVWANAPTKEWSEGVGLAIQGFAPVFGYMASESGMFTSAREVVDDMIWAMRQIAWGIIGVAAVFEIGGAGLKYTGYPPKKWAEGVGIGIKLFSETYGWMMENSSWFSDFDEDDIEDIEKVLRSVAWGIIKVAGVFSFGKNVMGVTYEGQPTLYWSKSVGQAIKLFSESAEGGGLWKAYWAMDSMVGIARGLVNIALTLSSLSDLPEIDSSSLKNIIESVLTLPKAISQDEGLLGIIGLFKPTTDVIDGGWYMPDRVVTTPGPLTQALTSIADTIVAVAGKLSWLNFIPIPPQEKIKAIVNGILALPKAISEDFGTDLFTILMSGPLVSNFFDHVTDSLYKMADAMSYLGMKLEDVSSEKLSALGELARAKNLRNLQIMEIQQNADGYGMGDAGKNIIMINNGTENVEPAKSGPAEGGEKPVTNKELFEVLNQINQKMAIVANSANSIANYTDEKMLEDDDTGIEKQTSGEEQ